MSPTVSEPTALPVDKLGELPAAYQDDALVLLVRNPHTLFVYWDFAPATVAAAFEGLPSGHAVMRLLDGKSVARDIEISLEARSWYVQGVEPNRDYRAEIHAVGVDGRSRRIGRSSSQVTLPSPEPVAMVQDKFVHIPWEMSLQRAADVKPHDVAPAPITHAEAAKLSPSRPAESDFPGRPWHGSSDQSGGR